MVKAKEMPVTISKLRQLLKSKHSYIERHLSSVVSIIRHSMQTSAAFEAAVQHLKERHMEIVRLCLHKFDDLHIYYRGVSVLYGDYYES
jgi:hypothetical protein